MHLARFAGMTPQPRTRRRTVRRSTAAVGVAAGSAVVLAPAGASVSGASVVVADGRQGTLWTGANGAMGASGVLLDVFGDGEALHR